MTELLTQIILAARDRETEPEGFMRLFVWLLVVAIWIVGGILKVKANKARQQGTEQGEPKPRFKPFGTTAPSKAPQRIRRAPHPAGPAPGARPYPQVKPPGREVARLAAVAAKVSPTAKSVFLDSASLKEPIVQLQVDAKPIPLKPKYRPATTPAQQYLPVLDDPDELKRAILHYEILGRPVALRDPFSYLFGD